MAINATTLSNNITNNQTVFGVASATGITAPNFTTGANVTYLFVDFEMMLVTQVSGTQITVERGVYGTRAVAHNASNSVLAGLVTDFVNFAPSITAFTTNTLQRFQGVASPVAAAATITPTGSTFHITGTTATSKINLPSTDFLEGRITVIADALWTWTSSSAALGIAQAGTVTSLGTTVDFFYDAKTSLWYASRTA